MSQLERRLTLELSRAIGYGEKMKEAYDREVKERKKMTEMYLEANQACIDAEAERDEFAKQICKQYNQLHPYHPTILESFTNVAREILRKEVNP